MPPLGEPALPSPTAVRAVLDHAHPQALVSPQGALLLANAAWLRRFGDASLLADRLPAASDSAPRALCIEMQAPGRGPPEQVLARVQHLPECLLLSLEGPPEARGVAELQRLQDRVCELEHLAATDHLTGAWNRAHFERLLATELCRSRQARQPVSLVLMDIDHFKHVNDTHGHSVGDSVLRELVAVVSQVTRSSDMLFRWGGEEFAVLVASSGYRSAQRLADKLCATVAAHVFRGVGRVTITLGVAEHLGDESCEAWFGRLDEALYEGKRQGRNRVVVDRRGNSDQWAEAGRGAALQLVWEESFECGEPTIDREHAELFDLANTVIASLSGGAAADPQASGDALDKLIAHVQQHFLDEEAILARHGYDELEQHRRAHAGLVRRAQHLRSRSRHEALSLGVVLDFVAQDMVARHMLVVDRGFHHLFHPAVAPADFTPAAGAASDCMPAV